MHWKNIEFFFIFLCLLCKKSSLNLHIKNICINNIKIYRKTKKNNIKKLQRRTEPVKFHFGRKKNSHSRKNQEKSLFVHQKTIKNGLFVVWNTKTISVLFSAIELSEKLNWFHWPGRIQFTTSAFLYVQTL